MLAQSLRQSHRERHIPESSPLGAVMWPSHSDRWQQS